MVVERYAFISGSDVELVHPLYDTAAPHDILLLNQKVCGLIQCAHVEQYDSLTLA